MAFRKQLADKLPFLRRYARALCGSQHTGDAHVRNLLEAAIADAALRDDLTRGRVELYRAFTRIWGSVRDGREDAVDPAEVGATSHLSRISPEHRQALLLTTLEEFTPAEAGVILDLEADEVLALVKRAIAEIDEEVATSVLIIEDESLIAMQLEALVTDIGHTVVATASARAEAVEAFAKFSPGLVLADIQLADSSSGIDAIEDILGIGKVPVVFVTGYPERLLTGERTEPTYLVTKPFREDAVRAAISQALFFGAGNPAV